MCVTICSPIQLILHHLLILRNQLCVLILLHTLSVFVKHFVSVILSCVTVRGPYNNNKTTLSRRNIPGTLQGRVTQINRKRYNML